MKWISQRLTYCLNCRYIADSITRNIGKAEPFLALHLWLGGEVLLFLSAYPCKTEEAERFRVQLQDTRIRDCAVVPDARLYAALWRPLGSRGSRRGRGPDECADRQVEVDIGRQAASGKDDYCGGDRDVQGPVP